MPAPYNLTAFTSSNNLFGFMDGANTVSGGLFGLLTLVVAFLIMLFAWRDYETKSSVAVASFLTALMSIFLRLLNWIPDAYMFGSFILAGLAFVVLKWS